MLSSNQKFVEFPWLLQQIDIIESEYFYLDVNSDKNDYLFKITSQINKLSKKLEE